MPAASARLAEVCRRSWRRILGTPALATRGFHADDFREVGRVIGEALTGEFSDAQRSELGERTRALADKHSLYPQLAEAAVA